MKLASTLLKRLSRETTSGRFIPEMDGLRFVAIAMVVLFHINGYLVAKSPLPRVALEAHTDWLASVAFVGSRGVELFFVISGFILALPFAAHHLAGGPQVNLSKYYLRRLTRLEPPYFVTVVVLFVLAVIVQGKSASALLPHLGASLFYLHSLIYGTFSPVIGVAWSLEIEVQFYLLVPVLTLWFSIQDRRLRRGLLLAVMIGCMAAQAVYSPGHPRFALSIFAYLQFFLTGFLLADVFVSDWQGKPTRSHWWDAVALTGWPLLIFSLHSPLLAQWLFPWGLFVLYYAAFRGVWADRCFSNAWVTVIGGMCYSIYLIHYLVVSAVGRSTLPLGAKAPYWIYLFIQTCLIGAAVVVVCGLYFVLLEKPCMRRDWPQQLSKMLRTRLHVGRTEAASAPLQD